MHNDLHLLGEILIFGSEAWQLDLGALSYIAIFHI